MRRAAAWKARLSERIVDVAFVVVVLSIGLWYQYSRSPYFLGDDWGLIAQAGSLRDIVDPYNDHLVLSVLLLYRGLAEAVGFRFAPFQIMGVLALLSAPVCYQITTRRHLGPFVAALAGVSMMGFRTPELLPAASALYLSLLGGILCAAALRRGRGADALLAGSLVLALTSSSAGVAVAAACLVHNAATRTWPRRWLVVVGPVAAWGAWWLILARGQTSRFRPAEPPSLGEAAEYARTVFLVPFEHLSLGIPGVSILLAVTFLGYGGWLLRRGLAASADFLAWSVALALWAAGIAWSRGAPILGEAQTQVVFGRYQFVALGFALLAIVPSQRVSRPSRSWIPVDPRWKFGSAALLLALALVQTLAIRPDVESRFARQDAFSRFIHAEMLVLTLGPEVIPDDAALGDGFFDLSAGAVRELLDRYGWPEGTGATAVDVGIVDLGVVATRGSERSAVACGSQVGLDVWSVAADEEVSFWSDQATSIQVRRFGRAWVDLIEAAPRVEMALTPPSLGSDAPWQVRADGACLVAKA